MFEAATLLFSVTRYSDVCDKSLLSYWLQTLFRQDGIEFRARVSLKAAPHLGPASIFLAPSLRFRGKGHMGFSIGQVRA